MLYQCWVEISSNGSFLCKNVVSAECVLSLYLWFYCSGHVSNVKEAPAEKEVNSQHCGIPLHIVSRLPDQDCHLWSFRLLWVQFVYNSIWYFTHSVYLDSQQWSRVPTGSHPTLDNQTKLYSWHSKHQKGRRLCITLLRNSFLHDSEDTHLSEAYRRPQEQEFLWGFGKWVLKKENKWINKISIFHTLK